VTTKVIMAAIINQAARKFNVDEADGVNRRHRLIADVNGLVSQPTTATNIRRARRFGRKINPLTTTHRVISPLLASAP
jgi:hypothetical protein